MTLLKNIRSGKPDGALNIPLLFGSMWLWMFVMYFPAAKAGFVADFTGWLDQVQHHSFSEYVNRSNFEVVSLYQVTQVVTWFVYKIFGVNPWLWHTLFITMHVVNVCMMVVLIAGLLRDAGVRNYRTVLYLGAALFCVSPYLTETIVWEPSFHYLQGLMLLLSVLLCAQRYIEQGQQKYILYGLLLFALSTHTLEVFYLTPWFILSMALFYRGLNGRGRPVFGRLFRFFFLPMLLIFILRLVEFRVLYGDWVSRIGSETAVQVAEGGLGKAAKHLFDLLFLARFLPSEWGGGIIGNFRSSMYDFCDGSLGLILFYSLSLLLLLFGVLRFRLLSGRLQVMLLLFVWTGAALLLITPLWFGDSLWVVFDRYKYVASGFLYMLLILLVWGIPWQNLKGVIIALLLLANQFYATKAVEYWTESSKVVNQLLDSIPVGNDKPIVLLNVPESLRGVPMLGAWPESEFKLMHNLLQPDKPLKGAVYDALAYNMQTPDDGANVLVLNDSTIRVTLNQWGTWWWYKGKGGQSYETDAYKLNLIDGGHFYEMTLKKPMQYYQLLYQVGDKWKVVDTDKRNEEQH